MALIDNIVSYWKLDESSGNAADATATANTLVNTSATYSPTNARINNGAVFDGSTSKLIAGSQWHPGSSDFSISLWFYAASITDLRVIMSEWNDAPSGITNQREFALAFVSSNVYFYASSNGTAATTANGATTISINTLYHLAVVKTGSTKMEVFLNGASDGSQTVGVPGTLFSSASSLEIGGALGFGGSAAQWFSGTIDEVGTWSRALTSTEVTSLYNSGLGLAYPFSTGQTIISSLALLGAG